MVVHHESAPDHVAKDTISYMKEHDINVIVPHEWLPESSNATPMGYSIWGAIKEQVQNQCQH